ncbi:GNAT family N-acetyltransferase [Candidatus Bipolaricaulota bacterium]|nr:GNAT family N-acetyltransferase [Candidatus Bipolaricaulota bacterium]
MDDADNLFQLDSDPEVMHYLTGGIPHSREFIIETSLPRYLGFYDRFDHFGFWAAIERKTARFMGWFHFRPHRENPEEIELGYRLMKRFWGAGYATEGSLALIEHGFRDLGVSKVVATTMTQNRRSRRVMEKIGLRFEREFVYPREPFPGWRAEDCMEVKYGLTRAQWLETTS